MNRVISFLKSYWPSALVLGVILYLTLANDPIGTEDIPMFPGADKLVHAIMMGGLVGAIAFDMQRRSKPRYVLRPIVMWGIAVCVIAFGGLDEISQAAMGKGRSSDPLDFVADSVGAIAAVYLAPPAIRKVLKVSKQPV